MTPQKSSQEEPSPEGIPGYHEFVHSLSEFAADRGILVDFQTRVAGKHIDLFKLYNIVTSRGGYDVVSTEKLGWRRVGGDFNVAHANAPASAFSLKTAYYRNLAAYEIKFFHGREPPPVEILEKLTAKGANILNRTVENFKPPVTRTGVANGAIDSDGEESKTPKDEKMDIDDPGSGGARTTRGLRQAPPQRVLFQPDVSSGRNVRHSSSHLQSPQPSTAMTAHTGYNYSASSNPNSSSFSIANYEPRPQMPMTLRPISTPGNNYPAFKAHIKRIRDAQRAQLGLTAPGTQGMMKPGAGFEGPNIYVRTLQGLRSPLPEEQDYALHHLVKISHERGDKYKFEAFPGLAEGLIEYVLEVSSLFYDVRWEICYSEDEHEINVLDGINGTQDILKRIECLRRLDEPDEMESVELSRKLTKILEAGLTVRNLSLLEDNAVYLADMPQLRDFLSIALNLPPSPLVTELKHYALDISEQVTKYWRMGPSDPLYVSLLAQVQDGHDRGASLTALRAISRISMNLEDSNLLTGISISVIRRVCDWVILDDEELVSACLDFLYQYTAVPDNVRYLMCNPSSLPMTSFLGQLTRLLQFRASTSHTKMVVTKPIPATAATEVPTVPAELLEQFLKYDEPDRSNHWLRSVFEEDPDSSITQIALWQAYQARFTEHVSPQTGLLPAAEFIKNVSTIFTGANAQVISGVNPKFIIKGIRPRHAPMDPKGRVYTRCLWRNPGSKKCGDFHLKPRHMFEHILYSHLGVAQKPDGTWNVAATSQEQLPPDCFWANCRHFARRDSLLPSSYELGMHVKTHLPDVSSKAVNHQKHNRTLVNQTQSIAPNGRAVSNGAQDFDQEYGREATHKQFMYLNTAVDEAGSAAGLPLTSVLILRNMARNVPKAVALMQDDDHDGMRKQWMDELFGPLKDKLLYVMAYNRPMAGYVSDVMSWVEKGTSE